MPFLHWFKKKSQISRAEADPPLAEKLVTEQANAPETVVDLLRQATAPAMPPNEQRLAQLQSIIQKPAVAPELEASESDASPARQHLSVPIGAFYMKLPAHLLAPKKPDLARYVQIAEEDVVIDQETQEATLPLSILSLSCPEIFARAVDDSEDLPVTFSLRHLQEPESPQAEESIRSKETEELLPPVAVVPHASTEAGEPSDSEEKELRLRLQPILSDFPPDLEPPSIHSLIGTEAEIDLPLGLIQSQLAYGRVVVPAELFCRALPNDLKAHFESIDPAAEIPIPLEEVFSRLPPEAIKLREDQEMDRPEEAIPTPFRAHAEEDAKRFSRVPAGGTANETPAPKDEPPQIADESDLKKLQAIFMTDEPLDLTKTIDKVAELPGLRSCILSTTDGIKLAGNLGDPEQEKAISTLLPELFQRTLVKLEGLRAGTLETITLYYDHRQLSTFVQGKLCLTVLHDNKPFKPGVREKIQAVISELAALRASEKPL
jgi:hypothetical protein